MAAIFIKFDGIEGETRDNAFPGYFEVDSFSYGASCGYDPSTFKATGRANYSPLSVSMSRHDKQCSAFYQFLNLKKVIPEVHLVWRQIEDEKPVNAWDIKFENCKIVDVVGSISGTDMVMPNYSLGIVYEKYTLMTRSVPEGGKPKDGLEVVFSLVENK